MIRQQLEADILGALIHDASQLATLDLQASDFADGYHAALFTEIARFHKVGIQPDAILLAAELGNSGASGDNLAYIGQIAANSFRRASLKPHVDTLKHHARKDAIERLAGQIYDCANDETADLASRLSDIRAAVADFEAALEVLPEASTAKDLAREAMQDLQRLWESDGKVTGISTGLQRLDGFTLGLQAGDLVIVAGRASMGKTLLAQQLALASAKAGKKTHFVTLEMAKAKLTQRFFAALADVPLQQILAGQFKGRDLQQQFEDAVSYFATLPLRMTDHANTVGKICSLARRERLQHGLDLLIIDQLSAMQIRGDNRASGLKDITGQLKQLAKELGIPVVLLHQINREAAKATDRRPDIHQLKDSGAVEEDADVVLMIHREAYYDQNANPEEAEIIIGKNRIGERGVKAVVGLNLGSCRFSDFPPSWSPQQREAAAEDEYTL